MIKGFESPHYHEPAEQNHWQWLPAVAGGLIAGVLMLIVPHASPWEGLTTFTPATLGREVPVSWGTSALAVVFLHLCLSVIYGIIISLCVMRMRGLWAVLVGGVVGLILYLINLGVVNMWFPAIRGNETSVLVTHIVFGLVAAGAYRGLLRRKAPVES
jgi:hypothetical protein